jgi:hypothetical protein
MYKQNVFFLFIDDSGGDLLALSTALKEDIKCLLLINEVNYFVNLFTQKFTNMFVYTKQLKQI